MDTINSLFSPLDYNWETNYWDFKPGDWWKPDYIVLSDNLTHVKAFWFEKAVDYNRVHKWTVNNWQISIYLSIVYLILVFVGQKFMKTRERFDLRRPLIIWNMLLAIFSFRGTVRVWQAMYSIYSIHGFKGTVCATEYFVNPVTNFWSMVFIWSKVPELIDTAFIVLRKRNLIFLHWYHHITVMIYSWYSFRDRLAGCQYYVSMNLCIHAIMYTYYSVVAMRIRIPKPVAMIITTLQTSQMFIGVAIQYFIYKWRKDEWCHNHYYNMRAASIMYGSYYILFAKFFLDAYVFKRKSAPKQKVESPQTLVKNQSNLKTNNVRKRH